MVPAFAVDFDTLTNKDVTIRERDSGKQVRLPISTVLEAAKTDITQLSTYFSNKKSI
jgi:glycyl-tRNA synthetase (class II)